MTQTVAALYVATGGCYFGLPDVDPWDEARDARLYDGPHPVVAHPPCQRWGRYWHGGPSAKVRRVAGDDGGCFAAAYDAVGRFGGVLEHPEASKAWAAFCIPRPPRAGGWILTGYEPLGIGMWTCCVEQGHYGHRARKATWLLYVGHVQPPELVWGPSGTRERLDPGFHSAAERAAAKASGVVPSRMHGRRLTPAENLRTPLPFRDMLLTLARFSRTGGR